MFCKKQCNLENEIEKMKITLNENRAWLQNIDYTIQEMKNIIELYTDFRFCITCLTVCKKDEIKPKHLRCNIYDCHFKKLCTSGE